MALRTGADIHGDHLHATMWLVHVSCLVADTHSLLNAQFVVVPAARFLSSYQLSLLIA